MKKKQILFGWLVFIFIMFIGCTTQTGNLIKEIELKNISNVSEKNITHISIDLNRLNLSEICFPDEETVKEIFGKDVDLTSICILRRVENITEKENLSSEEGEIRLETNKTKEIIIEEEKIPEILEKAEFVKTIVINETDIIKLNVSAVDPDGDPLIITFSKPLDEDGYWETTYGDFGEYIINISVSDGKDVVTQKIRLIVLKKDLPPEVEVPDRLVFKEGDFINLSKYIKVKDVHDDPITIDYIGWLDKPEYQTTYDDQGTYNMKIVVSDGTYNVTKYFVIEVLNVNRKPIVQLSYPKVVRGLDVVRLELNVTDPDGDNITVTFSDPFDENGIWNVPKFANGTYYFNVTVSDGYDEVIEFGKIEVLRYNTLPKIKLENMIISEDTYLNFLEFIEDEENDEIVVNVFGDINNTEWYFDYFSSGEYNFTIIACDYEGCTNKTLTFTVLNKNRPPIIEISDKHYIEETQNLTLTPRVYDLDNETVTYACYLQETLLDNCTFETDYDSAGTYEILIIATDGIANSKKTVEVIVLNKNRIPLVSDIDDIIVNEGEVLIFEPIILQEYKATDFQTEIYISSVKNQRVTIVKPKIFDPDLDDISWKLEGWLTNSTYEITYEDAGNYTQRFIVSDGEAQIVKEFRIIVKDVNRPPVIIGISVS
ncbi:MAG: hypothetical protein QW524_00915 [Candidatus Woesearchaeota archaeon]